MLQQAVNAAVTACRNDFATNFVPAIINWAMMPHKYRGSIVVLLISKSVEPNEEQKEMISNFQ